MAILLSDRGDGAQGEGGQRWSFLNGAGGEKLETKRKQMAKNKQGDFGGKRKEEAMTKRSLPLTKGNHRAPLKQASEGS